MMPFSLPESSPRLNRFNHLLCSVPRTNPERWGFLANCHPRRLCAHASKCSYLWQIGTRDLHLLYLKKLGVSMYRIFRYAIVNNNPSARNCELLEESHIRNGYVIAMATVHESDITDYVLLFGRCLWSLCTVPKYERMTVSKFTQDVILRVADIRMVP